MNVLFYVNLKHMKRKWHLNDFSIPFLPRNAIQSAVIGLTLAMTQLRKPS